MSEDNQPIISVRNISKRYCRELKRSLRYAVSDIVREVLPVKNNKSILRSGEFWALKSVSFELNRGESLAIIGENGAGKSTLLKVLYGLIKPDEGDVRIRGNVGAIIELGAGFDQILTGRENVFITASLFGFPKAKINSLFDEVVAFAELEEFIDSPIQFYSSGMKARLAFSVAAHLKPDILFVDEVLSVGDFSFQRKCLAHIQNYLKTGGSVIFVSHSPFQIQSICQRGILLEHGSPTFQGSAVETLSTYFERQQILHQDSSTSLNLQLSAKNPLIIKSVTTNEKIEKGRKFQLTVKYEALRDLENAVWGFNIWTQDQSVCICGNFNETPQTLRSGENELSCKIEKLPLNAGKYLLRTAIVDITTLRPLAIFGWLETPLLFEVKSEANVANNAFADLNQLITVDVDWN